MGERQYTPSPLPVGRPKNLQPKSSYYIVLNRLMHSHLRVLHCYYSSSRTRDRVGVAVPVVPTCCSACATSSARRSQRRTSPLSCASCACALSRGARRGSGRGQSARRAASAAWARLAQDDLQLVAAVRLSTRTMIVRATRARVAAAAVARRSLLVRAASCSGAGRGRL